MELTDSSLAYRQLPEFFYRDVAGREGGETHSVALNVPLGASLGLSEDWLRSEYGRDILSGVSAMDGGPALAMAYGGHQFGHWSGLLGDGRARLIGDLLGEDGHAYELHLKGSGLTPFSRRGDGKATLGSNLREYIVSEAMAALGVKTTRALSIVTTGETIVRNGIEPAAILCRTARSHLRVGTFQLAAASGDKENVKALADFAITRLYPNAPETGAERYAFFLNQVIEAQVSLICSWMGFGFIHGVMNTDNSSISGETIDYGPCAFMDEFHAGKVFSSIDRRGRYAWNRQPEMAHWNLTRLAETLLPLLGENSEEQDAVAEGALGRFSGLFTEKFNALMEAKFGLAVGTLTSSDFLEQSFEAMMAGQVDFTLFFRNLTRIARGEDHALLALFKDSDLGAKWIENWKSVSGFDGCLDLARVTEMQKANPIFIPRNHRVEEAIQDANAGDMNTFETLLKAVTNPFSENDALSDLETPPMPAEIVHQTFCGT